MPLQVVTTAKLSCSFGSSQSSFNATAAVACKSSQQQTGVINDHLAILNIRPFGRCSCLGNPVVAAATAANKGKLSPQPCIPATVSPWVPGSPTIMFRSMPALNNTSILNCMWGGIIRVDDAGQGTQLIP
jgi:hypothetical protein